MLIRHIGHAEFLIETESGMRIVTDPYGEGCGYPVRKLKADAALVSHGHHDHNAVDTLEGLKITTDREGIYTPAPGIRVTALKSFHDDEQGSRRGMTLLFLIEAEGLRIVQDHVGVPADDDAVAAGLGDLQQDLPLRSEKRTGPVGMVQGLVKAVPVGQLGVVPPVAGQYGTHVFRVQPLLFRQRGDDLPVVIIPAKDIGQALAQLPAPAAELP